MDFTKDQAERRFARVFTNLSERWQDATTFHRIAEIGLPAATSKIAAENEAFAKGLASDPQYEKLFLDRADAMAFVGGVRGVAESLTVNQVAAFRRAIDSASIIFMHSALDAAVTDLCYVGACAAPQDWEPYVADQKVTLSSLKTNGFTDLFEAKLQEHLKAVDRQSLLFRVDRLFAIAKPPSGYAPKRDYKYDRAKLMAADDLRHRIVHGDGSAVLSDVPSLLEFLFGTGLYLFSLLNWKYDVKLNPLYAMGVEIPTPPAPQPVG